VAAGFTPDDVRRLGALARLELTDDEVAVFAEQLSGILAFAAEVEACEAAADPTEPSGGTAPSPMREDEVRPSLSREDVLGGAPDSDPAAGLITVPRVFHA
jgi:aspartyl-tRNA(Asn)/glutamyl-tRNA(Gln) amidotransferase subunit C